MKNCENFFQIIKKLRYYK